MGLKYSAVKAPSSETEYASKFQPSFKNRPMCKHNLNVIESIHFHSVSINWNLDWEA